MGTHQEGDQVTDRIYYFILGTCAGVFAAGGLALLLMVHNADPACF